MSILTSASLLPALSIHIFHILTTIPYPPFSNFHRNKSKLTDLLTIYDYILKVIVSSSNSASAAQHGHSGGVYRSNENGGTTRRHSADSSTMKGAMGGQKGAVGAGNKDTNSTGNNISVGDRAKQEEILYEGE